MYMQMETKLRNKVEDMDFEKDYEAIELPIP